MPPLTPDPSVANLLSLFLVLSSIFLLFKSGLGGTKARKKSTINLVPQSNSYVFAKHLSFFFAKTMILRLTYHRRRMLRSSTSVNFSPGAICGSDDGAKKNMASWDLPRTFEPWRFNGLVRGKSSNEKTQWGNLRFIYIYMYIYYIMGLYGYYMDINDGYN